MPQTLIEQLQEIQDFLKYDPQGPPLHAEHLASALHSLVQITLAMAKRLEAVEGGYRQL